MEKDLKKEIKEEEMMNVAGGYAEGIVEDLYDNQEAGLLRGCKDELLQGRKDEQILQCGASEGEALVGSVIPSITDNDK